MSSTLFTPPALQYHPGGGLTGRAYRISPWLRGQSTSSHLHSNPLRPPLPTADGSGLSIFPQTHTGAITARLAAAPCIPHLNPRHAHNPICQSGRWSQTIHTHPTKHPGLLLQSAYLEALQLRPAFPRSVFCWSRQCQYLVCSSVTVNYPGSLKSTV